MAEKLALPLLLPNPPPSKLLFSIQSHQFQQQQHPPPTVPALAPSPPPRTPPPPPPHPPPHITPILQDLLTKQPSISPKSIGPRAHRRRTRIGRSRDPNRGKPWSNRCLSSQGSCRIVAIDFDLGSEGRKEIEGTVAHHSAVK
uniref:Pentatricopeptide repeat-containing protein At5g02860 n=1 Tax=Rhizophora mucronata TaxID=61149 RepID=A0A2P2KBR7_RHIMU